MTSLPSLSLLSMNPSEDVGGNLTGKKHGRNESSEDLWQLQKDAFNSIIYNIFEYTSQISPVNYVFFSMLRTESRYGKVFNIIKGEREDANFMATRCYRHLENVCMTSLNIDDESACTSKDMQSCLNGCIDELETEMEKYRTQLRRFSTLEYVQLKSSYVQNLRSLGEEGARFTDRPDKAFSGIDEIFGLLEHLPCRPCRGVSRGELGLADGVLQKIITQSLKGIVLLNEAPAREQMNWPTNNETVEKFRYVRHKMEEIDDVKPSSAFMGVAYSSGYVYKNKGISITDASSPHYCIVDIKLQDYEEEKVLYRVFLLHLPSSGGGNIHILNRILGIIKQETGKPSCNGDSKVFIIAGDTNINLQTLKKHPVHLVLPDFYIQKKRYVNNMFLNNQISKGGATNKMDGMIIGPIHDVSDLFVYNDSSGRFDCSSGRFVYNDDAKVKNGVVDHAKAFDFADVRVLADHSLLRKEVFGGVSSFSLFVGNAASVDDESKGSSSGFLGMPCPWIEGLQRSATKYFNDLIFEIFVYTSKIRTDNLRFEWMELEKTKDSVDCEYTLKYIMNIGHYILGNFLSKRDQIETEEILDPLVAIWSTRTSQQIPTQCLFPLEATGKREYTEACLESCIVTLGEELDACMSQLKEVYDNPFAFKDYEKLKGDYIQNLKSLGDKGARFTDRPDKAFSEIGAIFHGTQPFGGFEISSRLNEMSATGA
tara:strand:- start:2042 stop:4171 length:2130 start_codon:yes stop_codon:yes gene_type:complete